MSPLQMYRLRCRKTSLIAVLTVTQQAAAASKAGGVPPGCVNPRPVHRAPHALSAPDPGGSAHPLLPLSGHSSPWGPGTAQTRESARAGHMPTAFRQVWPLDTALHLLGSREMGHSACPRGRESKDEMWGHWSRRQSKKKKASKPNMDIRMFFAGKDSA